MKKKTKCWIEYFDKDGLNSTPILMWKKPTKREQNNSKEFGYRIFESELKLIKEI
jgi:hypothetical protein